MKRLHKRSFQLLEVLIAAFLVSVCAIPVMQTFTTLFREQKKMTRELQKDHFAHLFHARLTEYLYQWGAAGKSIDEILNRTLTLNEIGFNSSHPSQTKELESLEQYLQRSPFDAHYYLEIKRPYSKSKQETASHFLLTLHLKVFLKGQPVPDNPDYVYALYVKREHKEGQQSTSVGKKEDGKKKKS